MPNQKQFPEFHPQKPILHLKHDAPIAWEPIHLTMLTPSFPQDQRRIPTQEISQMQNDLLAARTLLLQQEDLFHKKYTVNNDGIVWPQIGVKERSDPSYTIIANVLHSKEKRLI